MKIHGKTQHSGYDLAREQRDKAGLFSACRARPVAKVKGGAQDCVVTVVRPCPARPAHRRGARYEVRLSPEATAETSATANNRHGRLRCSLQGVSRDGGSGVGLAATPNSNEKGWG
ncbi:hypothetical protein ACRE_087950 [Hapsidospora chrysogenum ATCC 11550]|uniref:Uncharacterized protein n=1 Tax=Hapsidospora chrysogenum (strain ATCC 11550 / CBS 779.69 / DSM 880 / IAM 14645 / JCM 23072 / IMI 49137) TaxID=857340 RepID=A0A086STT5_HAPC1|nr:hypothetical protein ACRE_087950 [Hapsidospora chrysogenum ATCC 11550]